MFFDNKRKSQKCAVIFATWGIVKNILVESSSNATSKLEDQDLNFEFPQVYDFLIVLNFQLGIAKIRYRVCF